MIRIFLFLIFFPALFLCCMSSSGERTNPSGAASDTILLKQHEHAAMPLPLFFKKLVKNHASAVHHLEKESFSNFLEEHELKQDSVNSSIFHQLKFYHTLFTSSAAANCSRAGILKIPYFWHWITPNPRHEIRFIKDSSLLKNTPPPAKFARYKCYADLDRTPDIFYEDLISEKPKYFSPDCGTFHTFGWCSEREMAFVLLMETLGYKSKVISSGNHTWAEIWVTMNGKKSKKDFIFRIDNTFDVFEATSVNEAGKTTWIQEEPSAKLPRWYNTVAHAPKYKTHLSGLTISKEAAQRIDREVYEYLKEKLN